MPLNRRNTQVYHRRLYAGQLETVTIYKRGDDLKEGTVTAYQIFQARRGNIHKGGQPIQGDLAVIHTVQWLLPCVELRRVGINYSNVIDRIVDKFNMWWQPESPQDITLAIFDNYYIINCVRIDPPNNQVLLGIPGVGL